MSKSNNTSERLRRRLLIAGPLLVLIIVAAFYLAGGRSVSTDDAYTQAAHVDVSAHIDGRVVRVYVHDNQPVRRGDPLFALDGRDFVLAERVAQARLADAQLHIRSLRATLDQRDAELRAARQTLAWQQREYARQKQLAQHDIASPAQLDSAAHALDAARQQVAVLGHARDNTLALLDRHPKLPVDQQPAVQLARAELDRARLDLARTVIRAPDDGIVTQVDNLQRGDYIKAGAAVFGLVLNHQTWVEANFKETDLAHMRPGQTAIIEIDAIPGRRFHGRVDSLSPGTGSSFALLPPENVSGNWIKVVQRLPVRIRIDDFHGDLPVHTGLSAEVSVDTGHSRLEDF